ncbi:MAG: cysteine--tRNA ligase [Actinomycetota bacterium]
MKRAGSDAAVLKPAEHKSEGFKIYDTLSREISAVSASNGEFVRIYCCGPTVYRDAHVGNLRTFLLADLVQRTLAFAGVKSQLVQNITDVGHMSEDFEEDKIIAQSKLEKKDPYSVAREYEARFHQDCRALNIRAADSYPRASECIDLMIDSITKLIADGLAYQGEDGSVYFDAAKFPSYGALSGNRLDALKPGHRFEFTEGGAKRFHADWALWKAAGSRSEMIWDTPWGRGFPGWHIECSAMSLKYLTGKVDLHIGGIDLRFPHHEDERAQSNSLIPGGGEAVTLWLHGEHLLFEGRKMSKSSGNVVLVSDVIARGIDPLAIRFCFMENRYRSQMDLSWSSIQAAHLTLERWRKSYQSWLKSPANLSERVNQLIAEIASAFNNDLDTPRAMISLRGIERGELEDGEKRALFEALDPLFGLDLLKQREAKRLTNEAEALLEKRKAARANRDFKLSDQIRDELSLLGIEVRDTSEGQEWSWKIN